MTQFDRSRLDRNECPFCAVGFNGWQFTQVIVHIFQCLLEDYDARMKEREEPGEPELEDHDN